MEYAGDMDKECVALCDAINALAGLQTIESCSGHDRATLKIHFLAEHLRGLPTLLYHSTSKYFGLGWKCTLGSECLNLVVLTLQSTAIGPEAYEQAQTIADRVMAHISKGGTPCQHK